MGTAVITSSAWGMGSQWRVWAARGTVLFLALSWVLAAGCASRRTGTDSGQSRPKPAAARPLVAEPVRGADPYLFPTSAPRIYAGSAMVIDARSGRTLSKKS